MDPNISTQPIPAEMPAQQPLPSRKSNKKMVFWIFAILLFLVAFLAGGFFMGIKQNISLNQKPTPTVVQSTPTPTSTPDPTADWKIFTSKKYGFSIKYPTNLAATEITTPFYSVEFKRNNATQGEFPVFELLASLSTFTAKSPAAYDFLSADIVSSLTAMAPNATKQVDTIIFTKLQDEVVAGQPAIVATVKSTVDSSTQQKRVFVKNNGNIYMFVNDLDNSSQQADFNNLLSTFKFTDQNQIDSTVNWKTYTNADYSFSFKYPDLLKVKVDKTTSTTTNFDNEKITENSYCYELTNSSYILSDVKTLKDYFLFCVQITPANNKTIDQSYNGKLGFGGERVSLIHLKDLQGTDEAVQLTGGIEGVTPTNNSRVYRKNNLFYKIGFAQQPPSVPDIGNGDAFVLLGRIEDTFKFTN